MTTPENMSRDTALRIALAARALPGTGVGQLLEILHQRIDGALTEASLQGITVTDLKIGLAGSEEDVDLLDTPMEALKDAVRILWGESAAADLPQPVAASEPPPPGTIRVAIASNNGERLDGHFGSCLRFLVYQVGADQRALIEIRSALEADLAEDKNAWRAERIADCQVLYVASIGGPAAAKVIKAGIYPIKKPEAQAADILAELQRVMRDAPPPWLAKLLGASAEQRVRFALSDEAAA